MPLPVAPARCAWPPRDLSPNARVHHMARHRAAKAYRADCAWTAKAAGWGPVQAETLTLRVTFMPPRHGRQDIDNMVARFKAGLDGLADVLGVDDSQFTLQFARKAPVKNGAVLVEVVE